MKTRTAVGVWTLALLAAVGAFSVVLTTEGADGSTGRAGLGVAVGLAFVVGGLVSKHRRPDNRMGWAMVVVGFTWFVPALTQSFEPVVFSLGAAFSDIPWAAFAYLVFAYPTGRLETRTAKAMVATAALITVFLRPLWVLFDDLREMYPEGAENAFLIEHRPGVAEALERTIQALALLLIAGTVVYLVRRWRAASAPLRRTLSPVYFTFAGTIVLLAVAVVSDILFGQTVSDVVFWITLAALLTVPLSFAVGLLRTRLARAGVSSLLVELGQGLRGPDLRAALAHALGDPSLEVGYWIPGRDSYVDSQGNRLSRPEGGDGRSAKVVERDGKPVALLVHDESVRSDSELLDAVAAAAAIALEDEQRVAALAESEGRHRALLEALPDLIFRMSKDGTYLAYTGNERDLAAPLEQTIGRKLHEVIPKEPADSILRCIQSVISSGGVQTVDYQLRMGPLNRHFEARIVRSGPDEVLLIVRDISDRKRTEAQLERLQDELRTRFEEIRRERDFVRAVVQAAPSLFCLVDQIGRILRFNKAIEETFGVTDDDPVRGRHFWDVFIAPEEVEEVRRNFLERPGENETTWRTADGRRVIVAWRVTELVEEHGEARFLITGVDVTERKLQEEELRSSRSRIVEAGDVERRRLERNLHDGAQQRLVSISLFLRLAEGKMEIDPAAAKELLIRAGEELTRALEELRELARGIHPAVLTDRGLEPALQALATRAAVPVRLEEAPDERLPEPVEAAAYYVVSEALTNIAKYAQASSATVRISRENGRALVEVADDGVGGANPMLGSGLRGLADRVEALDGRLEVESPPGRGTTVRAEIPVP